MKERKPEIVDLRLRGILIKGFRDRLIFNSAGVGISLLGVGIGVLELKIGDERAALVPFVLAGILILGVATNSLRQGKRIIENPKRQRRL